MIDTLAPSGTVTFLFTDIEGSTRLWEEHPDGMQVALEHHDQILRATVEARSGLVFSTGGDGFAVAFGSARDAVAAAVEAQRKLTREPWPEYVPIRVRMGIHTGEAQERDGDYFGPPLNRAARVMTAANGGQIVLTDTTAAVLGHVDGIELVDEGEHRLRDLSAPQRLFVVQAIGMVAVGAKLRTVDVVPGNLPTQLTSLIGRHAEIDIVASLLMSNRLVTLTGVGGVGKTRLASHVAAEVLPKFPDGAWLVELAALSDERAVGHAVAAALGLSLQGGMSAEQSVAEALAGRRLLLLLDNCEHLLDAVAALTSSILSRASSVSILATSREGLGLAGEQAWPVPSLDRGGVDSPAVELFVERARSAVPGFDPGSDASVVTEICGRLDGIPLAIELAAARVRSLSPVQIRDRLEDRFKLLTGGTRGAMRRHQTLHHTVQWSFDLLTDAERLVLSRLAVFAGGFDLGAAEALCATSAVELPQVLDILDSLVRKSLVTVDRGAPELRYGLLETIREFAENELGEAGEIEGTRNAHALYFASQGEENLEVFASRSQPMAFEWFDRNLANLRVAFRWTVDRGDLDTAARIACAGGYIGYWRLNYEPVGWAEELIDAARIQRLRHLPSLLASAANCVWLGRVAEARTFAEEAVALCDDPAFEAHRFGWEHMSLSLAGIFEGHTERFVEALVAGAGRPEDRRLLTNRCWQLWGLGAAGLVEEARAIAHDVVASAEATGIPWTIVGGMHGFGRAFAEIEPEAALRAYRRGLATARDTGNRWWIVATGSELGALEARVGEPLAALNTFKELIEWVWEAGDVSFLYRMFVWLVTVFDHFGRYDSAAILLGAIGDRRELVAPDVDVSGAVAHLRSVLGATTLDERYAAGAALEGGAAVQWVQQEIREARDGLEKSS